MGVAVVGALVGTADGGLVGAAVGNGVGASVKQEKVVTVQPLVVHVASAPDELLAYGKLHASVQEVPMALPAPQLFCTPLATGRGAALHAVAAQKEAVSRKALRKPVPQARLRTELGGSQPHLRTFLEFTMRHSAPAKHRHCHARAPWSGRPSNSATRHTRVAFKGQR